MSFNIFLESLRRLPRFRSATGGGVRGADTAGKLSAGAEVHGEPLRYEILDVSNHVKVGGFLIDGQIKRHREQTSCATKRQRLHRWRPGFVIGTPSVNANGPLV